MTQTSYIYDVSQDMPGGKVYPPRLEDEIRDSSISTTLDRVTVEGGTVEDSVVSGGTLQVVFASALTSSEKTTLDGDTTNPAGGLLGSHDNSSPDLSAFGLPDDRAVLVDFASSEAQQSTSSTTFVEAFSHVTPTLPVGTYMVDAFFELDRDASQSKVFAFARVQIDDSVAVVDVARGAAKGWGPNKGQRSVVLGSTGTIQIDFDHRSEDSDVNANIRRMRVFVWRIRR